MTETANKKPAPWVGKKTLLIGSAVVALLFMWLLWPNGSAVDTGDIATFEARRGPLSITVLEGGNIHALDSHEFRSEIKTSSSMSGTKILNIIEEGYEVTEEDVKEGKILVELDSSKIKERIFSQEVEFQTDMAQYAEADESRAIQASENQSNTKEIRQQVRFALLDFEKFLGSSAARELLKERDLPYDVASLTAFEEKLERERIEGDDEIETPVETDSIANSARRGGLHEVPDPGRTRRRRSAADAPQTPGRLALRGKRTRARRGKLRRVKTPGREAVHDPVRPRKRTGGS